MIVVMPSSPVFRSWDVRFGFHFTIGLHFTTVGSSSHGPMGRDGGAGVWSSNMHAHAPAHTLRVHAQAHTLRAHVHAHSFHISLLSLSPPLSLSRSSHTDLVMFFNWVEQTQSHARVAILFGARIDYSTPLSIIMLLEGATYIHAIYSLNSRVLPFWNNRPTF